MLANFFALEVVLGDSVDGSRELRHCVTESRVLQAEPRL